MTRCLYLGRKSRSTTERTSSVSNKICLNACKISPSRYNKITTSEKWREGSYCQAPLLIVVFNSYKVTKGLLDRFGDKRVIDSPITESGFCGLTVGAALAGLHPVVSKILALRNRF